jgi:hypothetical protein
VYRVDDNSNTLLGSSFSQAFTDGDSIGITHVGSTITIYFKSGAGSWTSLGTRTDGTYTGAGRIAIGGFDSTSLTFDDFGGGAL